MMIELPYNYSPRPYQVPVYKRFVQEEVKGARGVLVWHRRSGKDKTAWNIMICNSQRRIGTYYYIFPTYRQGKKIIWDGKDKRGFPFLAHVPDELIVKKNETEMRLELTNGSAIQIVGADNVDSLVGTNPVGCVFSEYALIHPSVWDLFRPILKENDGWALFLFTPRGKNHAYRLYSMAAKNPEWLCELRTIKDTHDSRGKRIIKDSDIERERSEGMSEELIQQEYFCSFLSGMQGSYYGDLIDRAEKENRIGLFPYDSHRLVHTSWDLGIDDATTIIFFQLQGGSVLDRHIPHCIDYFSWKGEGLPFYAKYLQQKPYVYGTHLAPHDICSREYSSGKTRLALAQELGISFTPAPRPLKKEDGIEAVRHLLTSTIFSVPACEQLLDCLKGYRKEWDDKNQVFRPTPVHDWTSHGADAFQTLALGIDEVIDSAVPGIQEKFESFSPFQDMSPEYGAYSF